MISLMLMCVNKNIFLILELESYQPAMTSNEAFLKCPCFLKFSLNIWGKEHHMSHHIMCFSLHAYLTRE